MSEGVDDNPITDYLKIISPDLTIEIRGYGGKNAVLPRDDMAGLIQGIVIKNGIGRYFSVPVGRNIGEWELINGVFLAVGEALSTSERISDFNTISKSILGIPGKYWDRET